MDYLILQQLPDGHIHIATTCLDETRAHTTAARLAKETSDGEFFVVKKLATYSHGRSPFVYNI